jgi:hypothetical protein
VNGWSEENSVLDGPSTQGCSRHVAGSAIVALTVRLDGAHSADDARPARAGLGSETLQAFECSGQLWRDGEVETAMGRTASRAGRDEA